MIALTPPTRPGADAVPEPTETPPLPSPGVVPDNPREEPVELMAPRHDLRATPVTDAQPQGLPTRGATLIPTTNVIES